MTTDGPPGGGLREDGAEVGVGRGQDAVLGPCEFKHLGVARSLQPAVPSMHDVVAGSGQRLGEARRQALVDEEPHAPGRSGSSRSWTASAA